MLRPRAYLEMHYVLFEEELKEGNKSVMEFLMDHTPESVNDSEEDKSNRVSRMLEYMRYLYPQCEKYLSYNSTVEGKLDN